jgi:hypothetical protein
VFNRGIANAQKTSKPFGGQILPSPIVGERLAAKNAQKKAKKNIISETMKRIIP